jgi:hypothetical protein
MTKYIMDMAKYLMREKIPFKLTSVNGNYNLESQYVNKRTFHRTQLLTGKELGFCNRVRSHAKKLDQGALFKKDYFESDIQYMECSKKLKNKCFEDVVEIDIDQAYWETAYQLKIIPKELYDMGLSDEISKRARMVALGSFAKKTYNYTFNGKQLLVHDVERSLTTENMWFTICKRVSDVMQEIKKTMGDDYIFYWVDGVYVKNNPETIEKVQQIIEKWGYIYTFWRCKPMV